MTRRVPGRRWWALLLAPLLLAALAVRLLAPEGWMPTRGGVTLCSGHMPAMPGHPGPEKRCDFAVAAPVAPPPPVVAWVAPVAVPAPQPVARVLPAPGRGLAAPPPFATGPPLLS